MTNNNKEKVKVEEGSQESERRERVEKIIDLLTDIDYGDQEVKAANILSFSKSNLSLDEISKLVEPFKDSYKDHKNSQVYRSGLY